MFNSNSRSSDIRFLSIPSGLPPLIPCAQASAMYGESHDGVMSHQELEHGKSCFSHHYVPHNIARYRRRNLLIIDIDAVRLWHAFRLLFVLLHSSFVLYMCTRPACGKYARPDITIEDLGPVRLDDHVRGASNAFDPSNVHPLRKFCLCRGTQPHGQSHMRRERWVWCG